MRSGSECGVESFSLYICAPPSIVGWVRTPVERGRDDVISSLCIGVVVSSRLHDIDLTRSWPRTICIVYWQHPNRWPQPISSRKLSGNLNTSILNGCSSLGVDASRLHWLNDLSARKIGLRNAIRQDGGGASTIGCQVDDIVRLDQGRVLEGWLNDEHAILNEDVLVSQGRLFEFAVTGIKVRNGLFSSRRLVSYPNPPTSASFVQILVLRPDEKSSLMTGQYLWWTTDEIPSYTKNPAIANPNANPINGMMVTHFSFGSFLALHGCSTSPFRTLLEWKYLAGSARTADEEPREDAGLEVKGDEKGFVLGADEISSPKGLLLLSGVPGLGVVAAETPLPLYCIEPSILRPPKTRRHKDQISIKYRYMCTRDCKFEVLLQWLSGNRTKRRSW